MEIRISVQTFLQHCSVEIDATEGNYNKLTDEKKRDLVAEKVYNGEFEYCMDIQDFDLLD